ncbi:TVP38/TMEM64 family protein [Spirochaetia bacterium]|nr:TVP38/TMEM64 family protein [Spirochaetia bacterium]
MDKDHKRLLLFASVFVLVTAGLCIVFWPLLSRLQDDVYRERFSAWIHSLGPKGILILSGLQVLQIVVAVIPGEPVELIAGAAYGTFGGLFICLGACVLASSFVYVLVRRFGESFLYRFFSKEKLERYTFLRFLHSRQKTAIAVFILFLIPGTPKDLLTYLVPLSGLKASHFILISGFARIPSILSSTWMGATAVQGNWLALLLLFAATAGLGLCGIFFSERIINSLRLN